MESDKKGGPAQVKPIQRRATQGPLDAPNLDESIIPEQKETAVPSHQPSTLAPAPARTVSIIPQSSTPAYIPKKKFAYLLRTEIYHKLSIVNLPPAFREEFYIVSARDSLESLLSKLESYLATGRLLHAAHLSASILTSSVINPTDYTTIFALFYIRLACLDLTGHTMIAAQESKALEDLSSEFYFIDTTDELHEKTEFDVDENNGNKYKDHIAPWQLRVLAVRLQSLGFNDARRGIAGLYDLGFYARNQLSHKKLSKEDVQLWKTRLADLGIRVVNSLIEMGDMETARRTLAGLGPADSNQHKMRMAMLYLHTGDVRAAESVIGGIHDDSKEILKCLLIMAEGNYIEAIAAWEDYLQSHPGKDDEGLILQNLAVCMLFTGRLNESRKMLETLVEHNHSFQSLIFNLATIYELCSERSSYALKMALTESVARQTSSGEVNVERPNIEFKI